MAAAVGLRPIDVPSIDHRGYTASDGWLRPAGISLLVSTVVSCCVCAACVFQDVFTRKGAQKLQILQDVNGVLTPVSALRWDYAIGSVNRQQHWVLDVLPGSKNRAYIFLPSSSCDICFEPG